MATTPFGLDCLHLTAIGEIEQMDLRPDNALDNELGQAPEIGVTPFFPHSSPPHILG